MSKKYILNTQIINKIFNEYNIKLIPQIDLINISIESKNSFNIYQSNFNLQYLHSFKLFILKDIIQIIKCICDLINQKNIKININDKNLKLILISEVELILKKKNYYSNEVIEKLINELEDIKNEYKNLNEYYKKLYKRMKLIEKENEELKKGKKDENKIDENKINEIEKRINRLETFLFIKNKNKNKIQLSKCNLKNINTFQPQNNYINSLSTFPSGNIISVSRDKSIIIYDIHLNILQQIQTAHDRVILYAEVKDENNFITCSGDKSIKLWIKKENKFIINQIIKNAHKEDVRKVIYCLNGNLISCSYDNTIKIWKINNNNNYESIINLVHFNKISSILFLEDK